MLTLFISYKFKELKVCMLRIFNFVNLIKFEHSIFALPFALSGAFLVKENGFPEAGIIFLIVLAMVSARSFAMSVNRIIDSKIDLENPRTKSREIPSGKIKTINAILFALISLFIFIYTAYKLPRICLLLLPIAAIWFLIYPFTKRFTFLSHLWLGIALGGSVLGGWLAAGGDVSSIIPYILGLAVTFWVAGFDIIYACQDFDFDKKNKLHSIPAYFGIKNGLLISRMFHIITIAALIFLGTIIKSSFIYWLGVAFVSAMLIYEQTLVKENDLSKINLAFFTLNGWVSVGFLGFILLEKILTW